ncbi:hypothetical protein QE152_g23484 [Popillia japonica]|uniref:Uncharacterized protein n=1 Tax=Popillia japonica TaxID=7064 RepID=A0AAW1KIL8_POPJA
MSLQVRLEKVFCVWRDGSHLGYQQAADSSLVNVTCNCAIDERIFAEAGLNHMMSCLGNGNYNPVQFSGTHYFCVDHNGFMVGELTEDRPDCPTVLNKIMYHSVVPQKYLLDELSVQVKQFTCF